jgi:hypothetical protein
MEEEHGDSKGKKGKRNNRIQRRIKRRRNMRIYW